MPSHFKLEVRFGFVVGGSTHILTTVYDDVLVVQEHRFAQGGQDVLMLIFRDGTRAGIPLRYVVDFKLISVGGKPGDAAAQGGSWSGSVSVN